MDKLDILAIMREDFNYSDLLKVKIEKVKVDKRNLLAAADEIAKEHEEEIEEGTRQKARMLSEGQERGLKEEQVMSEYGRFVPTRQTPILNLLYYTLKEDSSPMFEKLREEFFTKFGHSYDGLSREKLEEKYGAEHHTESVDDNVKTPPSMDEFIYGNMTHKQFQTVKKLKALSKSSNEQEAFLAYRACHKLCDKYDLEFDKIPCNIT
jgi:hypothetical protein